MMNSNLIVMFGDCYIAMQPVEPMFVSSCLSLVTVIIFVVLAINCTVLLWSFLSFTLHLYLIFLVACFVFLLLFMLAYIQVNV